MTAKASTCSAPDSGEEGPCLASWDNIDDDKDQNMSIRLESLPISRQEWEDMKAQNVRILAALSRSTDDHRRSRSKKRNKSKRKKRRRDSSATDTDDSSTSARPRGKKRPNMKSPKAQRGQIGSDSDYSHIRKDSRKDKEVLQIEDEADMDYQIENLLHLQEDRPGTSREEESVNEDSLLEGLQQVQDDYEEEDETGPKISDQLAKVVETMMKAKISEDKQRKNGEAQKTRELFCTCSQGQPRNLEPH